MVTQLVVSKIPSQKNAQLKKISVQTHTKMAYPFPRFHSQEGNTVMYHCCWRGAGQMR